MSLTSGSGSGWGFGGTIRLELEGNLPFVPSRVAYLAIADRGIDGFEVEIGGMDYGFEIDGILGMDFLMRARAVLDLGNLTVEFTRVQKY